MIGPVLILAAFALLFVIVATDLEKCCRVGAEVRGPRIKEAHGLSSRQAESTRGSLPDNQAGRYGGRDAR